MIILPDKNIPRSRVLMPLARGKWQSPSITQAKDYYGRPDVLLYCLTARGHDGGITWQGWFEDREDFDAFIEASLLGSLKTQKQLWSLCKPSWNADILAYSYEVKCVQFLCANAGEKQTWIVPEDWSNIGPFIFPAIQSYDELLAFTTTPTYFTSGTSDTVASNWTNTNTAECIGGGGGGANGFNTNGGGGGAYSKTTNITSLSPGGSVSYAVGSGGTGGAASTISIAGNAGSDSNFVNTSTLLAKAGSGGTGGGAGGGAGGLASSGVGSTKYNGGTGGAWSSGVYAGGGGGGAGGPSGAGNNGTAGVGQGNGGAGGSGGAGSGGAGGTPAAGVGGAGGNGTDLTSPYGSGGGGAGGYGSASVGYAGGAGGNYGGGGGSGGYNPPTVPVGGNGIQGVIKITYTPSISVFGFNSPMLGM